MRGLARGVSEGSSRGELVRGVSRGELARGVSEGSSRGELVRGVSEGS